MKSKKIFKAIGWISFTLFCLSVFTLLKFPTRKIQGMIDAQISSTLSSQGISFSATESHLSLLFGITYTLKEVTITPPPPAPITKIDRIEISPSLLPLLLAKTQAKAKITQGDQTLLIQASLQGRGQSFRIFMETEEIDLGKIGLLPIFAGIQGSLVLAGKADFEGKSDTFQDLTGEAKFMIKKIILDSQKIKGFSIPKISIQSGDIQIEASDKKIKIKTFQIGKSASSDDLVLSASGDITLGKTVDNSSLNIKTQFSFSPAVSQSFSLLNALLSAGKQSDGSFKYTLTGPLTSPIPSADSGV